MRLGIDLDGVVANFNAGWTRFYNREFGTDLSEFDVDGWDVIPSLTHFRHMGEFWEWAKDLDGASLFRHLDTFPGAVEAMYTLRSMGHHILIVTTKPAFAIHDTYSWLGQHKIPATEVHITEDKHLVDADVYLDDAPHILRQLVRHRPEATIVRFARQWNSELAGTETINDWDEYLSLIRRISKTRDE